MQLWQSECIHVTNIQGQETEDDSTLHYSLSLSLFLQKNHYPGF